MPNQLRRFFLSIAFFSFLYSGGAVASDQYQSEIGLGVFDIDYEDDSESGWNLGLLYYFHPLENSTGPYNEADFLDNESVAYLVVGNQKFESGSLNLDGPVNGFGLSLVPENKKYLANLMYTTIDIDDDYYKVEVRETTLEFGYYLDNTTAVKLGLTKNKTDFTNFATDKVDTSTVSLLYKKLLTLDEGRFFNVEVEINNADSDSGDWRELGVSADYYLDRTLGLGAGISLRSGEDDSDDETGMSIKISKFFDSQFSLAFQYKQTNSDGGDSDMINFFAGYRF